MTTADEYRLLGFADADREAAEAFTTDQAIVKDLADQIRAEIGKLGREPQLRMPEDGRNSVQAFLDTVPDIRRFHTERGIPDEISWASLADLGQQLKVSRRTHGEYSLETHWWLTIAGTWCSSRLRCRFFSRYTVDVGQGHVREHRIKHHAIVTLRVTGRHIALVGEKEVSFVPGDLLSKRFVGIRQQLVQCLRS